MFNLVKGLLKVQLEDNHFLFVFMADVEILKSPSQTILNGSGFDKPILVLVDKTCDEGLESISKQLC